MDQVKTIKLSEIIEAMHRIKKICIAFNKYKMVIISKETWDKKGVEVIVDKSGTKWLNEKHIEENLEQFSLQFSLRAITRKYPLKYIKQRQKIVDCGNYQPCRKFLHEKLAVTVVIDCRTVESCNLKRRLGFNLHDVINTKKQTVLCF